jgi:hypothetical protein
MFTERCPVAAYYSGHGDDDVCTLSKFAHWRSPISLFLAHSGSGVKSRGTVSVLANSIAYFVFITLSPILQALKIELHSAMLSATNTCRNG